MFLGLTVTGVLLMFYYVPSVERAYQDIAALETNVRFGLLMRNMHRWMAHGMVHHRLPAHDARLLHRRLQAAARVQLGRRRHPARPHAAAQLHRLPAALGPAGALGRSPSARTSVGSAPVLRRRDAAHRAVGGFEVGPNALIRFYTLHVIGLPLLAAIFMAVHFWRIRRDGGMAQAAVGGTTRWPSKPRAPQDQRRRARPRPKREREEELLVWPDLVFVEFICAVLFTITLHCSCRR